MILCGIAIKAPEKVKPEKERRITLVEKALIVPYGIEGNRVGNQSRQVTVLSAEQWEEACAIAGTNEPWHRRRAQLCIRGHRFSPEDKGKRIRFGEAVLEITGETEPCKRMNEVAQGLKDALTPLWRAGVTCRVIETGEIAVGMPCSFI